MGLRFLADQCVPLVVIETVRDAGYEILYQSIPCTIAYFRSKISVPLMSIAGS
jgi:hypothetical protein